MQFTEQFDVVVVGAGHAGCEAAMAAARLGLKTALYTLNVDLIAQMSCNPAIGGIAKGHLVREVDALGGIMGEITDAVGIQFRLLNTSRGPAVWSPRAQCDKQAYRLKMREVLESQPNLKIKQAEVADLIIEESLAVGRSSLANDPAFANDERPTTNDRIIRGIRLRDGRTVGAEAVIITTGTFLNGLIHCGEQQYPAGRSGEPAAVLLGESLKQLGLRGCRLKTGTPPRLDGRTIDWSKFQLQPGDADPTPFSFRTKRVAHHDSQVPCYIAWTTPETQRIIREKRASLADVQRPDSLDRAAILSFHRRQDRKVSRQNYAPAFPRTGRSEYARDLRERHEYVPAGRSSVGDSEIHSGPRICGDATSGICNRVRLDRSHRTRPDTRDQEDFSIISGGTNQWDQRL